MIVGPWLPPHTPIRVDGQAIGIYEVKVEPEMTTLRKPHLLCFVTNFAAHPSQRVVIHLHAS